MEFPTIDKFAKEVAEKALDEITYEGKTIREWAEIIAKQELCEDCISRETTLKAFAEKCGGECGCCEYNGSGYDTAENCKLIKSMPSVTPQPKMGKWIKRDSWSEGFGMGEKYGYYYECSECDKQVKGGYPECNYNYCPYCGSDNREEADE